MRYRTRTWEHPDGWDGPGWLLEQVQAFEIFMKRASERRPRCSLFGVREREP